MKFEDLKKLHQKKYREELGYFLVEGEHLVAELERAALGNAALRHCELYVTHERGTHESLFPIHVINARHMAQITETRSPQGIVALVPMLGVPASATSNERAICLFEIQDPGNLGTILRSLAWFGNFRCLLTPGSVDPYNSKVIRASMGALFHVPFEIDVPASRLQDHYRHIAWLHTSGRSIRDESFRNVDCLLFGNEARGVPKDLIEEIGAEAYTIKGTGKIESLNVATAVNICAYQLS